MGFRINRVYTRGGDSGLTGLVSGKRVKKNHLRVATYGEIDELNSVLGLVKEYLSTTTADLRPLIETLQQELFDLGSELATPPDGHYPGMWQASAADVARLELLCDQFGDGQPELTSFILPGGSKLVSYLHLARTVCRRAERSIVSLADELVEQNEAPLNPEILKYTNRLSDLFFVLCRWALAKEGKEPPLWIKASERT